MTPRVSRTGPRTAVRAVRAPAAVLIALCWALLLGTAPARAEDPVPLVADGRITDRAHALGARAPGVAAALDRLHEDRRVQLFAVYVDDFSGRTAQDWADTTAQQNGLGRDDVLLAVATDTRQYAYSVDEGFPLSDQVLGEVARESVEPALRRGDWAGAAVGAAEGLDAALAGPGRRDGSTVAGDYVLPVAVLAGAGLVAAYAYARRRRRAATRTTPASGNGAGAPEWEPDAAPPDPAALEAEADRTLVAIDDATRTSDEELGFARAQFGEAATRPYAGALAYAGSELAVAFRLRQRLDDEPERPGEDGAERRRTLREIVARCAAAGRRLDEEAETFDALRALERDPAPALEAVETAFRTLTGRTAAADSTLTALRQRYARGATAPVERHVEEAKEHLVAATASLNAARQALDARDPGEAAARVRAAESAVALVTALVDGVDRRAGELAGAVERLPAALAGARAAVAAAREAGAPAGHTGSSGPAALLPERIARAESVLIGVGRARAAGRHDPLDALRRVVRAEAALGEALTALGVQEREGGVEHARALLDRAVFTARAAVAAADDRVTAHRDAVGRAARTRLAEARRHLERAAGTAVPDAGGALAEALRADALARRALALADTDVRVEEGAPGTFGGNGRRAEQGDDGEHGDDGAPARHGNPSGQGEEP